MTVTKNIINIKEVLNKSNLKWLANNALFVTIHGSRAYGTSTPTSDVDVKGFCIPPKDYYIGFEKNFEQAEFKEPDGVIYEITKFFKLAKDNNPSILEILYTDESDWQLIKPLGKKIIENRDIFLSTKVNFTYGGYAHAQLHRIKNHKRWLENPVEKLPERSAFGLPEKMALPKDQMMAAMAEIQKKVESWDINWDLMDPAEKIHTQERISTMLAEVKLTSEDKWLVAGKTMGFDTNFIDVLKREHQYKQALADYHSYQEWKKSRNPQRAVLEAKFGYDTKHGMHLVRLYRMCREILETGKVIVKRHDAQDLLEIRNGAWKYYYLIEWAEKQQEICNELYRNCKILPKTADGEKLNNLCMEIIEKFLWRKRNYGRTETKLGL